VDTQEDSDAVRKLKKRKEKKLCSRASL